MALEESGVPKRLKTAPVYENLQLCRGSLRLGGLVDWSPAVMWTRRNGNLFPMRLYCSCCFRCSLTHLTLVTQTLSWLFLTARERASFFHHLHPPPPAPPPKNMESARCKQAVRGELMCCLMCVKMRDGRGRGRRDYFGKNHLNKVADFSFFLCPLLLLGGGGLRGAERSSGGLAARRGWWIINKGKGRRHTKATYRPLAPPCSGSKWGLSVWKYQGSAVGEARYLHICDVFPFVSIVLLFTAGCGFNPWHAVAAAVARSPYSGICRPMYECNECLCFLECLWVWWRCENCRPESHSHNAYGALMTIQTSSTDAYFHPTELIHIQTLGFVFIQETPKIRASLFRYERRCFLLLLSASSFWSSFGFRCHWRLSAAYFSLYIYSTTFWCEAVLCVRLPPSL